MRIYENCPENQNVAPAVRGSGPAKRRSRGSRVITTEAPPGGGSGAATLVDLMFGRGFEEEGTAVDGATGAVHVFLRSSSTSAACPFCGTVSGEFHGWSERNPRSMGLGGRLTVVHLKVRRYRCRCASCAHRTFTEENEALARYRHMFDACYIIAFTLGCFMSASAAGTVMGLLGIPMSDDAIRSLTARVRTLDDVDVEEIGVDDVCCRRGVSYYTIVYDSRTHVPIAVLPGRSGEALKVWLSCRTWIRRVSRDRASSLAKAISEALPGCVQVADRFHLFANVLECIKEVFRAEFPDRVWFADGSVTDSEPKKVRVPAFPAGCPEVSALDVDGSPPLGEDGAPVKVDASGPRGSAEEEAQIASELIEKMRSAVRIREAWESISEETVSEHHKAHLLGLAAKREHVSVATARKYLAMTEEEVEAIARPQERDGLSEKSAWIGNTIYKMLKEGHQPGIILTYLTGKEDGPPESTAKKHIINIARNHFGKKYCWWDFYKYVYPEGVETIPRGSIVKYITIKEKKLMEGTPVAKHYAELCERFPIVDRAAEIWNDFSAIFEEKDPEMMKAFLEKYEASMVTKFVEGAKADLEPVMNAVTEPDNSGFVEGGNSAFQLDKRMTGGRASPELILRRRYVQATLRRNLSPLSALFRDFHLVNIFPDLDKNDSNVS